MGGEGSPPGLVQAQRASDAALTQSDVGLAVFPDPNIYRAADLLIWCHGADAHAEAGRIADTMRGFGDQDGQSFWIKPGRAITELEAQPAITPQQLGELNTM
jgi:hypothetical protein